jgi:hypothetical protein
MERVLPLVALVVIGLADKDDDVHRRVGLPARPALGSQFLFGCGDGDVPACPGVGDDDET